jgi:4-alpha-glucanotransferase
VAGLWSGADLRALTQLGLAPNAEGTSAIRGRLRKWAKLDDDAPVAEVVEAAHRLLAGSRSLLVAGTLDDGLGVERRPNIPGTVDEWPNWCLPLPMSLEEIESAPGVRAIVSQLRGHRGP